MKRIIALVLALMMALSGAVFAGDTFNPNVAISADGLTVTIQGSSIFTFAPTLTVKCTLAEAHVTHNGQVVESSLDTEKQLITFAVADVNGGDYVITAGAAPEPQPEPETPPAQPPVVVVSKAYAIQSIDGVTVSHRTAKKGAWVVLTVTDADIIGLTVTTGKGAAVELTQLEKNRYGFEMPGSAITVTAQYAPVDPSLAFSDLDPNQWYHDAVVFALENGLMEGMGGSLFCPDAATTRGQIVTMLWRLEGKPAADYQMTFEDVSAGEWYAEAVRWAASEKIVEGWNGKFNPTGEITREQFAAILWRYAKYKGLDVSVGEDTNILSFADALSVSEYAIPAMQWACGAGLMEGDGVNLTPLAPASRVQAAALFQRFCQLP